MLYDQSAKGLGKEYWVHSASIRSWKRTYLSNPKAFTGSRTPS